MAPLETLHGWLEAFALELLLPRYGMLLFFCPNKRVHLISPPRMIEHTQAPTEYAIVWHIGIVTYIHSLHALASKLQPIPDICQKIEFALAAREQVG